jgi:hypothetical protein
MVVGKKNIRLVGATLYAAQSSSSAGWKTKGPETTMGGVSLTPYSPFIFSNN